MTRILFAFAVVPLLSAPLPAQQAPVAAESSTPPAVSVQSGSPQPTAADHILQDGTPVTLQLANDVSSATATAGQEISFEVVDDIDVDGVTVLRKGARAIGVVTEAAAKKRMGRAGKLSFTINYVSLADDEKAALRSVNDTRGDSHVAGMTGLMLSMPVVAAPFFLLMHGEDTSFPKGTEITAFVNGDMRLDLARFGGVPTTTASSAIVFTTLVVDSDPPGAEVEIDGSRVGNTPITVSVASGSHRLSVRKTAFAEWSEVEEIGGVTVHVSATLKKLDW